MGNIFQGNETTLPVTLDQMIYHTIAVAKGIDRAMLRPDIFERPKKRKKSKRSSASHASV